MTTAASTRDRGQTRADAERYLRALVGRADARLYDDQWAAIEALVLDRRRALVVQRTGWGKSAVYFVATALLREAGAGPTVIVSPLLALMRNQIEAARRAGIRAATINSTNLEEWQAIQDEIAAGRIDLLLVSPERLNNPTFRDNVLPRLTDTVGLLVIDEAHCISDWGHDFRPDYRRIRQMLAGLAPDIPVLATTATANARVTADVAEQLEPSGTGRVDDVLVLRGPLDRETLRLAVLTLSTPEERLAWLADNLAGLPGSGIVYTLTVAATHDIASYLSDQGYPVAAYSGQTDPTERLALEEALLDGRLKALVATSALGMGFDAHLGFVVNVGAPASPIAYYQQIGRAGRGLPDGAQAPVVLLPAAEDRAIWRYFSSLGFPAEDQVRAALAALDPVEPRSLPVLETFVDLSRTRLEMMLKVLDVDGAVRRVAGGWVSTGVSWFYDAARYERVAAARTQEQQLMLDYIDTDRCRMRFLRETLDDPAADDCGRCDNCGGVSLPTTVSADGVAHAADRLSRPGVAVPPRRLWPTALSNVGVDLAGRISAGAEEGRVVGRLTDLGWGPALASVLRSDAPDQTVPVPLVRAVLDVVGGWFAEVSRPDGIVGFTSVTRPRLLDDLVAGLSRQLQIPVLGRIVVTDTAIEPGAGATNSARRIAAVSARCSLQAEDVVGRRVLLVDDLVATGWTMTLGAFWLGQRGASTVLPFALALER